MNVEPVAVPPIDAWPAVVALKESPAVVAAFKAMHLLGVSLLTGTVLAFDLRILGMNKGISVSSLSRHLLPLAVMALVLIVPSGVVLFALEASTLLVSSALKLKFVLLFAAAGLAVLFRTVVYKDVVSWDRDCPAPGTARICAAGSMVIWIGVLYFAATIGRGT